MARSGKAKLSRSSKPPAEKLSKTKQTPVYSEASPPKPDINEPPLADEQISSQAKLPSKNPDPLGRDSDVRFSNIVKASPMGILLWQLESDGRLVLVGTNPATDRILGVDCTKFIGQTIEQAFPPLAQTKLPEIYRTVAATGTPWYSDEFAYEDPLIKGIYEVHAFQTSPGQVAAMFNDISDRKEIEASLQAKEADQALILRSVPLVLYSAQASGDFATTWTSGRAYEITGIDAYRFIDEPDFWASRIHPDDRDRAIQTFRRIPETGSCTMEYRWQHADGSYLWFLDQAVLVPDKQGQPREIIGTWVDITERKRTEEELRNASKRLFTGEEQLRDSEERFRDFFRNAPVGFHVFGPDHIITNINDLELDMIGYTRDEIVGKKTWTDLIIPQQKEQFEKHWHDIITKGQIRNLEYTLVHKDGHHVNVILNASSRLDKQGNIINTRGSVLDITERKRAEELLEESEAKYRDLYDNAPDMFVSVDAKTAKIIHCNQTFVEAMGYTKEEIIGRPVFDMYHPDSKEDVKRTFESFATTGEIRGAELQLRRKDGTKIEISLNVTAVRDEQGNILQSRSVCRDITERKRVEEEINNLAKFPSENTSPVLRIDLDGKLLYANAASEELLDDWNCQVEQAVPQRWHQLVRNALESGSKRLEEYELSGRIYSFNIVPLTEAGYANLYGRDISDRKKAEESLRASRDYLENLTNSMWDAVFSVKMPERVIEWANDSFNLTGYDPKECIGKTTEFMYPDKDEFLAFGRKLNRTMAEGNDVLHTEQLLKRKNGEKFSADIMTTVLREKGAVVRVTSIIRDITERKQAEERLQFTHRFLEISNRHSEMKPLLKEFVAAVKDYTGCSAVGIRILDEQGNIPYESYRGFSQKFYESENFLSIKNHQCMCTKVITGKVDPSLPCYTEGGSFCISDTTNFLDKVPPQQRGQFRSVCYEAGYESLALFPIRLGDRIFGLIHIVDPRENAFPPKIVEVMEPAAVQLGTAIQRVWSEEALQKAKDELEIRVRQRTADLSRTVDELETEVTDRIRAEKKLQDEQRRLYSVLQMLPGYVILHGPDHKIRFANDRFLELFGEPGDRPCYDLMRRQNQPCDTCQVLNVLNSQAPQEWEWTCMAGRTYHVWGYPFTDVDETQVMLELGIDITERKNLETEVLRISENERQRIGQDLHDSLSQTLSGISCLSQVLHNKLAAKSMPEAQDVARIESLITDSIKLTQSLARGLTPVGVESEGLMSALRDLASNVENMFNIHCVFQCDQPVLIEDKLVATHTYRIAQEAINNAVRHGQAQNVIISLTLSNAAVVLSIEDDGRGLPKHITKNAGMGLRIMNYRARTIGATLSVQSRSQGGTSVVCRLKQTPPMES